MDYPKVRASKICPLCHQGKEQNLLVCWVCYHKHLMRYGNPTAERLISQAESRLSGAPDASFESLSGTRDL